MVIRRLQAFFAALFFSITAFAGHETGAIIITYESVAHVNNNPLEYVLTAYQVYDKTAVPPPMSKSINLNGCYPSITYTLPRITATGNNLLPLIGSDYCSPSTSIQSNYGLGVFQDTITLPGTCANFQFSATSIGPFNYFDNLSTNFGTAYFQVMLNNTAGPTSSPSFPVSDIMQAACLNKPLQLYNFSEPDGDSVYYSNSVPLLSSGGTPGPYSYSAGYSQNNQVGSSVGYSLDSSNGSLQTTLTSAGSFVITIRYSEYRYDTAANQMKNIGIGRISFLLTGSPNCNTAPFELTHRSVPNPDSLECGDSTLMLATTRKISASSITSSGSEFEVYAQNAGTSLAVVSASVVSDSVLILQLNQAVPGNDVISVMAKNGSDSDIVLSRCGKELTAFADTLLFYSPSSGAVSAGFTYTANFLNVNFNSGTTSSNATAFSWDFGDGSTAVSAANPSHQYTTAGSYNVRLIATNDCGISDTVIQLVEVCDTLTGDFSFTQTGDSLYFDAAASAGASDYYWQFGDGNSGTGVQSSHTYTSSGNYLVSLTVVNACGDSSVVRDSVAVCAAPLADWTYNIVSSSGSGMVVNFDGTASTNVQRFVWDFGDGTQDSSSLTPTHTYATPSLNYRVTLRIYNQCEGTDVRSFKLNEIGLAEMTSQAEIQLYPNPAHSQLKIEWDPTADVPAIINIYDLNGKQMSAVNPAGTDLQNGYMQLDISAFPEGVYLVKIAGEGLQRQSLVVIKR